MNISDTMASIRWLFEKHMKDVSVPLAPASSFQRKEQAPSAVITLELILGALKLHKQGWMTTEIAKRWETSPTTISNIIHRKRGYTTMPVGERAIKQWFGQKKKKHEPTTFN
jgi:hypothetical protein